ncbi:MAG TPA: hypothetical protein VEI95_01050 [Acidobacteriota bacterium]|nr:hypothetical protein [Acidobacteriota bacterium]
MFGSFYVKKFCAAVLAASVLLTCFPTPLFAATGSVRIVITRTNFIFGGGSGTLHLQGKRYELRVGGVSVGPLGAPRVDLVGRAYGMRSAASIHGIYSVAAPDAASRPGTVRLQNWHGVILELRGRQGVKPSVNLNGLDIALR